MYSIIRKLEQLRIRILHVICKNIPGSRLRCILHKWRGVNIGRNVHIGSGAHLDDSMPSKIYVENGAFITARVFILVHKRNISSYSKGDWIGDQDMDFAPVLIKSGAHIGVGSIIMPGVTVGKGSIIGAGSVVTKSIPDYSIAVGSPAKVVKSIK